MYVRFVSPQPLEQRRGYYGIFQAALDIVYDDTTPEHFYLPLRELLDWFNDHLPNPREDSFLVRSRRHRHHVGLCWFRGGASEMIRNAHLMAAMLKECDRPTAMITTQSPGQILYQDDYQVVAKPEAITPLEWC
ncbi:hypothetical protein [Parasphingorhabdus sp.]|uniref:hypothetical protein n=1 Tax=Parasphingorhabdus sp. TaxID=2709688 RepID=UPI003D28A73F